LAGIHKVDLQILRIHSPLDQARNCYRRDTSLIEHPPNKSSWFDLLHRRISACIILQKESVASTRNCCRSLSQHVQISVPVCRALELWCTALSCSLLFSLEREGRKSGARRKASGRVQGVLWLRARDTVGRGAWRREAGFSGAGHPGKHRAPSSFQTYCPRNVHLLVPLFLHTYQNSYGIIYIYIYIYIKLM
jgi:hypothetical protein